MARRLTRREFLAFTGALTGTAAALGGAALVRRPGAVAPAVTASTVPAPPAVPSQPAAPAAAAAATGPVAQAAPTGSAVTVLCRDAWGARPVSGTLVPHTIERLTVHHTATRLDRNRDAPARARGHQRYHQEAGWPDLAYHFLVDANGHVYEGRPFTAKGDTFTSYDPAGHFLVCCEGNFDQQDVPAAQFDALAAMLAWASGEFGVGADTIGGHRDYAATTCPGDRLAAPLADGSLAAAVDRLVSGGGVALQTVCGDDGRALIDAIEAGTDETFATRPSGFFFRHDNGPGTADTEVPFGAPDWLPVAGDTAP